jgi:hypothetical protein
LISSYWLVFYNYYLVIFIFKNTHDYNSFILSIHELFFLLINNRIDLIIPIFFYSFISFIDHFIDDYENKMYIETIIDIYKNDRKINYPK